MHQLRLALLSALLITVGGCYTHIDPGHVGVEITSCSGGGVNPKPLSVGYHGTGACTTIIEYPVFVQTAVWTHKLTEGEPVNEEITFTNADQMQIAADISIAYQLLPDKAPAFYDKFRADKLHDFTHGFLHSLAREKFDTIAGKYRIEQIMGDNAAFLLEVRVALQQELTPYGIRIEQFGLIGAPRPPQQVIDGINAKAGATQKAMQIENELKQAEAEARKTVAQAEGASKSAVAAAEGEAKAMRLRADAEAYANERLSRSLSPALVEYLKVQKWNGILPQVQGSGGTLLQLGGSK